MWSRLAAGGLFWALAAPLIYEGGAIIFRNDPTISRIVAYQIQTSPSWATLWAFLAGITVVALAFHFTGALPWWRP